MPKDIENMIKDNSVPVTIKFESESLTLQPSLNESGLCFYLYKKGLVQSEFTLAKFDETEGSFTIPNGYAALLQPIMGEVKLFTQGEYKNLQFPFSMKGHSFDVGTAVATIYLIKLEKISLVKTN